MKRRREENLDSKMGGVLVGGLLVLIAIILGVMQHFGNYNMYGDQSNKWYFYGLLGVLALIGIILAAWGYMKKAPTPTSEKPAQ